MAAGLEGGRGGQRLSPARPGADPDAGGHGDGKGRGGHGDGGEGTGWHGGTGGLRAPRPDAHPSIHPSLHPSILQPSPCSNNPRTPCAHPKGGAPMGFTPRAPPRQPPSLTEALQQGRPALHLQPRGGPAPSAAPPPALRLCGAPPSSFQAPFFWAAKRASGGRQQPFYSLLTQPAAPSSSPPPPLGSDPGLSYRGGGCGGGGFAFPSLPSSSLLALDSSLVRTAELLLTPAPAPLIKAAQ